MLEGHSDGAESMAFSPDGKLIASGSIGKTVRLCDVVTGAALQKLEGHSGKDGQALGRRDGGRATDARGPFGSGLVSCLLAERQAEIEYALAST
jgi:WD40 repeat protein